MANTTKRDTHPGSTPRLATMNPDRPSEGAGSAKKAAADQWMRFSDNVIAASQDQLEAYMAMTNKAMEFVQELGEEITGFSNSLMGDNTEIMRRVYASRTINDIYRLQDQAFKQNMEHMLEVTSMFSERLFDYSEEMMDVLNGYLKQANRRLSKSSS